MAKKTTTRSRSSKSADEGAVQFDVTAHVLMPKHELCSDAQKKEVLEYYKVLPLQMPRILSTDPAIQHLSANEGDLIKITRISPTAGTTVFYRIVTVE